MVTLHLRSGGRCTGKQIAQVHRITAAAPGAHLQHEVHAACGGLVVWAASAVRQPPKGSPWLVRPCVHLRLSVAHTGSMQATLCLLMICDVEHRCRLIARHCRSRPHIQSTLTSASCCLASGAVPSPPCDPSALATWTAAAARPKPLRTLPHMLPVTRPTLLPKPPTADPMSSSPSCTAEPAC